jgi:hypothetical protein
MEQEQSIILGALVAVAALASIWWRSSSWRAAAFLTLLLLSFGLVAAYGALSPLPLPQTMFCVAILAVAYSAALEYALGGRWRYALINAAMSAGFAGLFVFGAVEDELTKQWARATYFFFRSVFG